MNEVRLFMWLKQQHQNNDKLTLNERVMIKKRMVSIAEKHVKF
jgi:hypothetical protein